MLQIHSKYWPVPAGNVSRQLTNSFFYSFYAVGIVIIIGGFTVQMSAVDTSQTLQAAAGSSFSQSILGCFYLFSAVLLIRLTGLTAIAFRFWPILLLPCLAFVSAAWSPDPELTVRRSFAFLGTIVFGLSLASYFTFKDGLRVIVRALSVSMLLSMLWAVIIPSQGVHQITDSAVFQPEHAGLWRGIFAHRNILGFIAGLTTAILIVHGRFIFRSRLIRLGALAVSIACLIGARSGSGIAAAVIIPLLMIFLSFCAHLTPNIRIPALIFFSLAAAGSVVFWEEIIAAALALLDKSPDFTGRTPYWYYLLQLVSEDEPILGYGYYAGFALTIAPRIFSVTNLAFVSPHNGYLDVLVAFGYFGLSICVLLLLWLLWRSVRFVAFGAPGLGSLNAVPLAIIIFVVGYNIVEPSIITPNSIVCVILGWLTPSLAGFRTIYTHATRSIDL